MDHFIQKTFSLFRIFGEESSSLTLKNFLCCVGQLKFRGTSVLLRSPKPIAEISKRKLTDVDADAKSDAEDRRASKKRRFSGDRRNDANVADTDASQNSLLSQSKVTSVDQYWSKVCGMVLTFLS